MTAEERFEIGWEGFKRLVIRTIGRQKAAAKLRECADWLDAENGVEVRKAKLEGAGNVVTLEPRR